MNVKKTVKKIMALGAGVTMVGATIMGAMAYDLATYPAPFVANGVFDGKIVVGEKAATSDVMGAVDIAASLQAKAVSKKPVNIPGIAGQVALEGDTFKIGSGSDKLELREAIGDVTDTVSESDLSGLKSGRVSTSQGDTEYAQYIRLKDSTNLQEMGVNFIADDDNTMADYLVVDIDSPFIEWEMQFSKGLKSAIAGSAFELTDLEDEVLNIMGQDFTIVKATTDSLTVPTTIEITLMGGSLHSTLREGETKTFTIDGVEYEITLIFVSDPSAGGTDAVNEAKFMVNGEVTKSLREGDTDTLSGGMQFGVRDILVNSRDGVASFYIGADKVVFTDSDIAESDFDVSSGSVEINQDSISDGEVQVAASYYGTNKLEITSIKYRLTMNGDRSSIAYVPKGQGVKEYMRYPRSLISESLDVKYMGLEDVKTEDFKILNRGDDRYQVSFTNIQGQTYTFPYISNVDSVWRFGDNNYDLVFVEAASAAAYNIGRNDYFVVSNGAQDKKSVTNVLRYRSYVKDAKTFNFEDLATGAMRSVIVSGTTTGTGSLVIGGHTYAVNANNVSLNEPLIGIDLNADGDYQDVVKLTTWGGAVIDLAEAFTLNATADEVAGNYANLSGVVGNGKNLTIAAGATYTDPYVKMSMSIEEGLFDSALGGEKLNWTVNRAGSSSNPQVDLTTSTAYYQENMADSANEYSKFSMDNKDDSTNEYKIGMTDYGVYIAHYNPSGSNDPDTLTLSIPEKQRFAQVFVTMGTVSASESGSSVETETVNPIAVGLAVLDSNAPAVGSSNLIVVGGPCANTVAAELLGNPAECAAGFEAGKAMIKSFESNGKVAILVAGYEAQETVGASYVLANYADYAANFKGSEVEVVVPDMSNLIVQSVQ